MQPFSQSLHHRAAPWLLRIVYPPSVFPAVCAKHQVVLLTGGGGLTDKSNELFFYFLHGVQIVHKEDVSITGLAGNIHQLPVVSVRKANGEDDISWEWGKKKMIHYKVKMRGKDYGE